MEFITSDQRIAVENFYIGKIYTITFKNGSYITRACIGKGADYVMFQEEAPKMLFTLNMQTASTIDSIEIGGGGSGTTNYNELDNKPQINSVTLSGNKSSSDLGLQDAISAEDPISANYVSGLATVATSGAYSDLSGLPTLGTAAAAAASDFATAAQGSKADSADSAISTAATGFASLDARLDSMDTTISGKQGALSSTQLDAVNSGIDSTKVSQIETNKTNISLITPTVAGGLVNGSTTYSLVSSATLNLPNAAGIPYTTVSRVTMSYKAGSYPRGMIISWSNDSSDFDTVGNILAKWESTENVEAMNISTVLFNAGDYDIPIYFWLKTAATTQGRVYTVLERFR